MNIAVYIAYIFLLVQVHVLCPSEASNQHDCDRNNEFLCSKDKECIPISKVCNFENDCSDGEDETSCGSCDFQIKPERCGLVIKPDRVFTWFRKRSQRVGDASFRSRRDSFYYMYIDVAKNHKQYLERGHDSLNIIYRPKVLFPHLKPTNNEKCSFVFDVFVKDMPAKIPSNSKANLSWPNINVLLIQQRDKEEEGFVKGSGTKEYKTFDLKLEKTIGNGSRTMWLTKDILIGARFTVWTLELVVEMKLTSFLIHLSNFRFLNCQNTNRANNNDDDDLKLDGADLLDSNNECDKNQFMCILSGICIDKSLLCDFGNDCGDDDTSDEEFCDNYPGRCDFEGQTKCDWASSPSYDSWIMMSALLEDQAGYENQTHSASRPHVDHTFMSDIIGGHYIMLNTQKISPSRTYRFIGPNVALREGAEECSFRFWVYTPTNLDSVKFESVQFMAGYERILTDELFNHKSDFKSTLKNDAFSYRSLSQNWKRYETQLLSPDIKVQGSLFVQVSFGQMSQSDFKSFSDNKGFIALDDFSFTPGCSLTFEGEVVDNMCGDNEFFCKISTPVTNIYCIPNEYYCDFKNDCGSYKSSNEKQTTIDEQDCPHECLFHNKDHCGYEIVDGDNLKLTGEISEKSEINEAFSYARVYSKQSNDDTSGQGYLIIHAHGDKYLRRLDRKGMINLRDFRIELPTFSVSHANCLFEITYIWTPDTQNIFSVISIEREQFSGQSIILERLVPTRDSMLVKRTVKLGIGNQSQFKVVIEILYDGNLDESTDDRESERRGSFYLYEYKFTNCDFPHGLISSSKSDIRFEEPADDYGFFDYPVSMPTLNASCEPGFFQCLEPMVCIEDRYICDLQHDCQTSRLDELNCGDVLRFTFEDYDIGELPRGWSRSFSNHDGYHWQIEIASGSFEVNPPFDHTLFVEDGKFLMVKGKPDSDKTVTAINSARFERRVSNSDSLVYRMVFYLYFKAKRTESSLRIYRERRPNLERKLIFEAKIGNKNDLSRININSEEKAWHRIELPDIFVDENEVDSTKREIGRLIREDSYEDNFSIVFEATLSEFEFIAVDDISLTSTRELKEEKSSKGKKQEESIEFRGKNSPQIEPENNPIKEGQLVSEKKRSATTLVVLVLLVAFVVSSLVILAVLAIRKQLPNRVESPRKLNWRRLVTLGHRLRVGQPMSNGSMEIGEDGNYFTLNNLTSGN